MGGFFVWKERVINVVLEIIVKLIAGFFVLACISAVKKDVDERKYGDAALSGLLALIVTIVMFS